MGRPTKPHTLLSHPQDGIGKQIYTHHATLLCASKYECAKRDDCFSRHNVLKSRRLPAWVIVVCQLLVFLVDRVKVCLRFMPNFAVEFGVAHINEHDWLLFSLNFDAALQTLLLMQHCDRLRTGCMSRKQNVALTYCSGDAFRRNNVFKRTKTLELLEIAASQYAVADICIVSL